jgi:hypothetical protein
MREFAEQPLLEVWYAHLDVEQTIREFKSQIKAKKYKETEKALAKARTRDSTQALGKLTTLVDGRPRIISDPPLIVPVEELYPDMEAAAMNEQVRDVLGKYRRTLQSDRRHPNNGGTVSSHSARSALSPSTRKMSPA